MSFVKLMQTANGEIEAFDEKGVVDKKTCKHDFAVDRQKPLFGIHCAKCGEKPEIAYLCECESSNTELSLCPYELEINNAEKWCLCCKSCRKRCEDEI